MLSALERRKGRDSSERVDLPREGVGGRGFLQDDLRAAEAGLLPVALLGGRAGGLGGLRRAGRVLAALPRHGARLLREPCVRVRGQVAKRRGVFASGRVLARHQPEGPVQRQENERPDKDDAGDDDEGCLGADGREHDRADEGHRGVRGPLGEVAAAHPDRVHVHRHPGGNKLIAEAVEQHVDDVDADGPEAGQGDARRDDEAHAYAGEQGRYHEARRLPERTCEPGLVDPAGGQRRQHAEAQHLAQGHDPARDLGAHAPLPPPVEGQQCEVLPYGHGRDKVGEDHSPGADGHPP
mmetsp:Transcript_82910/g.234907  ORF Transcript_82910/g.234907 Transcript_82910/m.234907 type:complete len:295 (-) Transcript_82910:475-1359(-)